VARSDKARWRAGFELEVILGDLDDPKFAEDLEDPMDEASPEYCRAVARELTARTQLRWRARREERWFRPGFYVVSEYGLDPLHWPYGRVAGVELLTPPLPLNEAQSVREKIADAIAEIDGTFNFGNHPVTADCAWHINIDAGDELGLDPGLYAATANELPLLVENDRLFSRYAAMQRHAYGPTLLRHLARDPEGLLLERAGLRNVIAGSAGASKSFAANFGKLAQGYVELRHFSASSFFYGPPLDELLKPITDAFTVWREGELESRLLQRFKLLAAWLRQEQPNIDVRYGEFGFSHAMGVLDFHGEPLGQLMFNGTGELRLYRARDHAGSYALQPVHFGDLPQAVALLLLDLAELKNMGVRLEPIANGQLRKAVTSFAAKLRRAGLTNEGHHETMSATLRAQTDEAASWGGGDAATAQSL